MLSPEVLLDLDVGGPPRQQHVFLVDGAVGEVIRQFSVSGKWIGVARVGNRVVLASNSGAISSFSISS